VKVAEVMTPNVTLVQPEQSIVEAAKTMAAVDIGALPVEENDRLVGMITDRDIVVRGIAKGITTDGKVREVMTEKISYCFDDDEIEKAAEAMAQQRVRRLAVLNRGKRLVGMISLGDIAAADIEGDVSGGTLRGVSRKGPPPAQEGSKK
jgi:CBS domain-containing protein